MFKRIIKLRVITRLSSISFLFAGIFLFSLHFANSAHALTPTLVEELFGAEQEEGFGDVFGGHVSANDDWLIVGAPREDVDLDLSGTFDAANGEINTGAVYIYRRTPAGLVFHQKLDGFGNTKTSVGDRFGAGVTLQGEWLIIGAANDNDFPAFVDPLPDPRGSFFFAGKVYAYRYNAGADIWELAQELISDEPFSLGQFGARTGTNHVVPFAIQEGSGNPKLLLIGEPVNRFGQGFQGKLHVFKLKGGSWQRIQIARSPSGSLESFLGDQIVRAGKFALVTERIIDPDLAPTGTAQVHVYRIDNDEGIVKFKGKLAPVQTLESPNAPVDLEGCETPLRAFGAAAMAAGGDIVVISENCDAFTSAVHVYAVGKGNKSPLILLQSLPNPGLTAYYGSNGSPGPQALATDGNLIVVGTTSVHITDESVDVDIYERQSDGSFSLSVSLPNPVPATNIFRGFWGTSVYLIGSGQMMISRRGQVFEGGGSVFVYDID